MEMENIYVISVSLLLERGWLRFVFLYFLSRINMASSDALGGHNIRVAYFSALRIYF